MYLKNKLLKQFKKKYDYSKEKYKKRKKVHERNFNRQKRTKLSKDKTLEKGDDGSSLSIC